MKRLPCLLALSVAILLVLGTGSARAQGDHVQLEPEPDLPSAQVAEPAPADAVPQASYLAGSADPENCLSCHKFRGLSTLDPETGELRLFFCSAEYYAHQAGPHARLRCTGCHAAEEYDQIPHTPQTAVDCTQTCHLVPASGVEVEFSHQEVAERLLDSAHSPEELAELEWERPLLREGQSQCLYCHDQPVFRQPELEQRSHRGFEATARCDTCHDERLPVRVDYYMKHAVSRLQPARPVRQLVQVCAVCHSEQAITEQMGSHDAVASYLHSFHGKASLLGSQETATCVDCHAYETGDVHLMLSAGDEAAPTSEERLGDTCRSLDCHPAAPPGISSAAVHLEIDPGARNIEFYVASFFVLLTAGVMSLYFVWILLELFNAAVRRGCPEHHRMVRLARKLLAHPQGRELLQRLTVHQRFQHWALAIFFFVLVLTGMPIKFADDAWAAALVQALGGLSYARALHRIAGVILCVAFLYHLVYMLVVGWKPLVATLRQRSMRALVKLLFDIPVMITLTDVKQFLELFLYLAFLRKERPLHRHFKFSEKFEYLAVFWGMAIIGFSGIALWVGPMVAKLLPGWVLNFAFIVHSDEAYLAFIYIAVVHLFTVMLAPAVFPLSLGSLTGDAPAEELVEGHLGSLLEVAEKLGVTVDEEPAHRPGLLALLAGLLRRGYALALLVVVAMVCYGSMHFLGSLLFTRPAAPAEIREIPRWLDADSLSQPGHAHAGVGAATEEAELQTRGPLAHFHKIPNWFIPDNANSCTTSGCHQALPHGEREQSRAFLNMHTTFVDCQVCHMGVTSDDTVVRWLGTADREPRDAPALLQLTRELEQLQLEGFGDRGAASERLESLLRKALQEAGQQAELARWLLELQTTHPDSRTWERLVMEMLEGMPLHVHGEYGAKLGRVDARGVAIPLSAVQLEAAEELVLLDSSASEDSRRQLQERVHEGVSTEGHRCTPCHTADDGLVDFWALGYSPARMRDLKSNVVIRQALQIEEGESFFLPRVLGDRDED